jgi:hypothetical protein
LGWQRLDLFDQILQRIVLTVLQSDLASGQAALRTIASDFLLCELQERSLHVNLNSLFEIVLRQRRQSQFE